jgi:signal transduction histidine kinase
MAFIDRLQGVTGRLLLGFGVAISVLLIQAGIGAYYDHAYLLKRQAANELWRTIHHLEVMSLSVNRLVRPANYVVKTWQAEAAQEIFAAEYGMLQGDIREVMDALQSRRVELQQIALQMEQGAAKLNVVVQKFLQTAGRVQHAVTQGDAPSPVETLKAQASAELEGILLAQEAELTYIDLLRDLLEQDAAALHRTMELGIHRPIWITFGVASLIAMLLALLASSIIRSIRGRVERLTNLLDKQVYRDVERLEELNEKKSQFVSYVAHELKSPLSVIKGGVNNMIAQTYGPISPDQREAMGLIEGTIDRLARMIRDLLDLSRIESGKMTVRAESVDVGTMVRGVLASYREEAQKKGITVEEKIANDLRPIEGDQDRLVQVVTNVVTNAIRHAPDHGHVGIHVAQENGSIRLAIEDNGMGIHHDDLERIFEAFEQVDPDLRKGTGLGLPIAREIVKLHGGRIWAESQYGKGTRMIVELPHTSSSRIKPLSV